MIKCGHGSCGLEDKTVLRQKQNPLWLEKLEDNNGLIFENEYLQLLNQVIITRHFNLMLGM